MDEESSFALIWTESAIADLDDICSFVATDDQRAAERIGRGILEHVELLARYIVPKCNLRTRLSAKLRFVAWIEVV